MRARILIAEDDAIVALRIRKVVEAMGHDAVGLAATCEDAIRLTEELRPDVVLMDVRLRGEMTGVAAAARIQAGSQTPIIYVTAYSDAPLIEQAARTAPYAYLTKPIRDRELHAAIEIALYRSRMDRALAHLTRVLRSVRDVNQLITRERDPRRLLDRACEILLDTSGYRVVWIVQPDETAGHLRTHAHAGEAANVLAWMATLLAVAGESPFTTALSTGRPQLTNEPLSAAAVAIVPMLHASRSYGLLCVHGAMPEPFDADEIDLLQELAGDLAFALRGLDEEASRKRAERALEESHENWRRLVEYQPTGNVVHRDGTILYVNAAALRIVGLASEREAVGVDVMAFVHEDSRAFVATRLFELARGDPQGAADVRLTRADGQPVDVEMTSLAVSYLGQPAIQSVFWDVTERRRAEEQLRLAQKLDSVGRLAAGIAHDFNNMLLGIMGHTHLLMDSLHPSDARIEHTDAILGSAQRCGDLSRQLLAFSRRQVLELRAVDVRGVVRQVETLLRGSLHEDVRLQVQLPVEPCLVQADVGQLEQVLINLAINAQDAMPRGGTLTIAVAAPATGATPAAVDGPPDPGVAIVVTDTGCGMDAFTRERVFEPFFTTKEPGKGTGLGLAMVHGIVKQHGGYIELRTEAGAGTTFIITLPASTEAVPEVKVPTDAAGPTGTETVLVVEDTVPALTVTVDLLRRRGYTVLAAESGRAALALLDRHTGPVDVLLADVVMPGMNGKDLAARVAGRFPGVKVLFMSGHEPSVLVSHGMDDAGGRLLAKPFSPVELATRIRRALDGA
jgi:two-component system cell cycle sensor histidine kinase/response regulator CckA